MHSRPFPAFSALTDGVFFAINVDFEGHSAVLFTQCKKMSSLTEGLILMQVQCQFTSGQKINSGATPE